MKNQFRKAPIYLVAAATAILIYSKAPVHAKTTSVAEEGQATPRKSLGDILREKKIDTNFEKTDIRDILRHISKVAEVNICFCESETKGKSHYPVTTYLGNVSAYETLDIVTRISGLSYYIDRNVIWVGRIDELKELMKTKTLENILKQTKIDLNFKQADIRDVLSYIAKATETNIYFYERNPEEESEYRISTLLKDISAFTALHMVTSIKGLSFYIDDYVILVGKDDELGDLLGIVSRTYNARHGNVEQLKAIIENLLSEKGKLIADKRRNKLIITDREDVIETIDEVLEAID